MALSVFVASHDELERWQTPGFQVGCSPRWKTAPPMIRAVPSGCPWLHLLPRRAIAGKRESRPDPQQHLPALHVAAVEHEVEQASGVKDGIAPVALDQEIGRAVDIRAVDIKVTSRVGRCGGIHKVAIEKVAIEI
jgi:hypothetical protein